MAIQNRPYAGTWVANKRSIVQWTPDFLVYLNGDTSLPGCRTCHHNINLNEFINSISVDFGVEPGASNCSIGMSVPRHYGDSIFRDGNTLLRPGLEVHVYFRGFFPMRGLTTPNAQPIAGINLSDIPQYPYYPVFHGVVTQVNQEFSGGFFTVNMTCAGMLHFWEHQKVSGSGGGAFFGARPVNSGIQTTLTGHPLTGKTPYGIIYSLYRDTSGVADGVGFALQSRTNYGAVNSTTGDPLYAMTLRYWEQRFRGKIYGLRMHGASGQLFTSSQQAYLSLYRTSPFGGRSGTANVSPSTGYPTDDAFAQDPTLLLGLRAVGADGRVLRQVDTRLLPSENGGQLGLDVTQLQAYPTDIGSYGQVNLWESTYESKMDVATAVTNVSGYEFYQDADGDLVFKPPLYNLDTSSSRVYRIEPEDIISFSQTEAEPSATYVIVKGGAFQNMRGVVDESEWGCRSTYVDYRLVAQFGWIESSVESTYYTNPRSAFYFAINHLDRQNVGMNSASVTIPLRPEIRPGYPVYIPHIDCFYYVTSVSHSFNLGSECTTTLTLTCRRRKFFPPGRPDAQSIGTDQNLSQIDLSATANPVRALEYLDNEGYPRLLGFPNVVMAIDPNAVNPQFAVVGFQAVERELRATSRQTDRNGRSVVTDSDNARRQQWVWSFITMMLNRSPRMLNPIGVDTTGSNLSPRQTTDALARNPDQQYQVVGLTGANNAAVTVNVERIRRALESYINNRAAIRQAKAILVNRVVAQQNAINQARATAQQNSNRAILSGQTPTSDGPDTSAQEAEITRLQNFINQIDRNFDAVPASASLNDFMTQYNNLAEAVNEAARAQGNRTTNGGGRAGGPNAPENAQPANRTPRLQTISIVSSASAAVNNDVILMSYLIGNYRMGGMNSTDVQTDPSGLVNTSANLLEQLSDRKASLNLTVPGYYRYYSASHPNPDMQGYAPVDREVTASAQGLSQATEGTVTRDGRIIGDVREVPRQRTYLTGEQAAGEIIQAWRDTHNGQSPPNGVVEVLVSQWALETGAGRSMLNYNFGGTKAIRRGLRTRYGTTEGAVSTGNFRRAVSWFQAYGSAAEGARAFVRLISQGSHREALVQYQRILNQPGGTPQAAAEAYIRQLRRTNYFTGDVEDYVRNVSATTAGRARTWVQNATRAGTPTTSNPLGTNADPLNNPASDPLAYSVPDSEIKTSVVRPAVNVEGVPEGRQTDYVELGEHVPRNGLRVRTATDQNPRVVPTNLIYTMTFEARAQQNLTRVQVNTFNPQNPRQLASFINACLTGTAQSLGPFANALADNFALKVGSAAMTQVRTTPDQISELIRDAVAGIEGLRDPQGLIQLNTQQYVNRRSRGRGAAELNADLVAIRNIDNGRPNDFNPSDVTDIRINHGNAGPARRVLVAKAVALVREISLANYVQLVNAQGQLNAPRAQLTPQILDLIRPWSDSLTRLFRGSPLPQYGPFQPTNTVRLQEGTQQYNSPVYPVSDALGYEHYGSFQYGRGLSIEPGGNYERLMSTDPLQFATDAQREAFLRALRSNPNNPAQRIAAIRQSLTSIASDPAFVNGPGAQVALDYLENSQRNGDRTTMIANGLRNYILSDRDAVMKLPVNNVAYRLADLSPLGEQDTCVCRGAEADLLLAAYMAGSTNFVAVQTVDEVSEWVSSQMIQASAAWSDAQSKMRGMALESGRRSILDTVDGWQGVVDNFRSTNQNLANNAAQGVAQGVSNINQTTGRIRVPSRE